MTLNGARAVGSLVGRGCAAISDVQFALLLRDSYGWSLDRIETWITATSRTLLLGAPDPHA